MGPMSKDVAAQIQSFAAIAPREAQSQGVASSVVKANLAPAASVDKKTLPAQFALTNPKSMVRTLLHSTASTNRVSPAAR